MTIVPPRNLHGICRFCKPPEPERILFSGDHVYLMLSLGPLVEGHVLAISREHVSCCGALSGVAANEFDHLLLKVESVLEQAYGCALFFEHGRTGTSLPGLVTGTHCHHAHVHCIPSEAELTSVLDAQFHGSAVTGWHQLRESYRGCGRAYLFADDALRRRLYFVNDEDVPSQLLRRELARLLGHEERTDWRREPGRELIKAGKETLRPYFASPFT